MAKLEKSNFARKKVVTPVIKNSVFFLHVIILRASFHFSRINYLSIAYSNVRALKTRHNSFVCVSQGLVIQCKKKLFRRSFAREKNYINSIYYSSVRSISKKIIYIYVYFASHYKTLCTKFSCISYRNHPHRFP